jgi:hypothetical protein
LSGKKREQTICGLTAHSSPQSKRGVIMFFLFNTKEWIEEIVRLMNERQLKPENSRFMIAIFSSMDNEFVRYFRDNKDKISSFSGRNFHIFTPLIYEGDTIPDNLWREMRGKFKHSGIPLTTDPTFVFFRLEGNIRESTHVYYPEFFAGFACSSFDNFPNKLKNAIEICVETKDERLLVEKLTGIFSSENILWHGHFDELRDEISNDLPKSTLFVSHSSLDKPFVRKLIDELSDDNSINVWVDEKEILAGDDIQQTITNTLRYESDFFLLVISENSTKSSWVQFEVSQFMGFAEGRNIIPIVISKKYDFPKPIESLITRLKYLDFTDEAQWQSNIQELKRVITKNNRS